MKPKSQAKDTQNDLWKRLTVIYQKKKVDSRKELLRCYLAVQGN